MEKTETQQMSEKWARDKGIEGAVIGEFRGEYDFLSNFYRYSVKVKGHVFKNNESAFQAFKCSNRIKEFYNLSPNQAKSLGRSVALRSDWEEIKDKVMYSIVRSKFSRDPVMKEKLLNTGDTYLIEGNSWGDSYWGVSKGKGLNKLGEILMRVRSGLTE